MDNSPAVAAAVRGLADNFSNFKSQQERELARLRADIDYSATKAGRAGLSLSSGGGQEIPADQKAGIERYLRSGDQRELKAVQLAVNADGGFALPKEIDTVILHAIKARSVMRRLSRVEQASTSDYNVIVSTTAAGAAWAGEGDSRSETTSPAFANVKPLFGELHALPRASNFALQDIPDLQAWLVEELAEQFATVEDLAFISGDGSSKPRGFLNYPTAATADSSRAFGTIEHVPTGVAGDWPATGSGIYDLLVSVVFKLRAQYRENATWLMPPAALETLRRVKDGQGNPIWSPGMAGTPSSLMGYNVVESEQMPAKAANALHVAFGDFRAGYLVADRTSTQLLVDPYSQKGQTLFYTSRRVGGALLRSDAIKVVKFSVA